MDGSVQERKSGIMTIFGRAFFKNQDFKIVNLGDNGICGAGET